MLTILIATAGRPKSIQRTLESIVRAKQPNGHWRIHVAINGGDKESLDVVTSFQQRLPLKCIFVEEPGKNKALNQIVGSITDGLVVFTDDDVSVDTDWLCAWEKKALSNEPNKIFAGAISLQLDESLAAKAKELKLSRSFMFVETSFTEESVGTGEMCWGGNLAIHSNVFKQGYRFSEFFGPNGRWNYPMGSEVELCIRLEKAGYEVILYPASKVSHKVRSEQVKDDYIFKRYFRAGRSSYFMRLSNCENISFPFHLLSGLFFLSTRLLRRRFWSDPSYHADSISQTGFLSGQFYQYLRGPESFKNKCENDRNSDV